MSGCLTKRKVPHSSFRRQVLLHLKDGEEAPDYGIKQNKEFLWATTKGD